MSVDVAGREDRLYRQKRFWRDAVLLAVFTALWLVTCTVEVHVIRFDDPGIGSSSSHPGRILILEEGCIRFGWIAWAGKPSEGYWWTGAGKKFGVLGWAGTRQNQGSMELDILLLDGWPRPLFVSRYIEIPLWLMPVGWLLLCGRRWARKTG